MLQDIEPHRYGVEYYDYKPQNEDILLLYGKKSIFTQNGEKGLRFPTYEILAGKLESVSYQYAFSIDSIRYFLVLPETEIEEEDKSFAIVDYSFQPLVVLREAQPQYQAFAGITGRQLQQWYLDNQFCGHCGNRLEAGKQERMLHCNNCANIIYPKISPAIIVGITNGNRIVLTQYAGREYKRDALVAGFNEIGESLEKTVAREVMEEVGLKVKNLRYYKSQPWAFTGCLLVGFFAELDGEDTITREEKELAQARWVRADEIELGENEISLTREMMSEFVAQHKH